MLEEVWGGSTICASCPATLAPVTSRWERRFAGQVWHLMTFSCVCKRVSHVSANVSANVWKVFCVAGAILSSFSEDELHFLASAALWRPPTSYCVAGAAFGSDPSCVDFCAASAIFRRVHTLYFTLYTLRFTFHILHFTLHTTHSTLSALHTPHFTPCCPQFALHTPHLTLLQSTLYTLQSTLYTVHSTLYTLHSTLYTVHMCDIV